MSKLSRMEMAAWLARWRDTFARNVPDAIGRALPEEGEHGVFDQQFMTKFLRDGKAEQAYQDATAEQTIVIWSADRGRRGELREKPSTAELRTLAAEGQALVFDIDLEWTALFHHDDGMPTCFARHEWVGFE